MANMDFTIWIKYNSYVMMEDRYVYCDLQDPPLCQVKKEITMEMLKDEPIILFNTDSVQTRDGNHLAFVLRELPLMFICIAVSWTTVLNYVRGSKCGAFLYSSIAANPRISWKFPLLRRLPANLESYGKGYLRAGSTAGKFVNL